MAKILPIFPLPNTVLFPGVSVHLHIFEERYKRMIADIRKSDMPLIISYASMEDDRLIPKKTATIGDVRVLKEYDDGRMDIIVHGRNYAQISEIDSNEKPYDQASYETKIIDENLDRTIQEIGKERLINLIKRFSLFNLNYSTQVMKFYTREKHLDYLLNTIAYYNISNFDLKQEVLELNELQVKYTFTENFLSKIVESLRKNIENHIYPEHLIRRLN
ncbi:MAG: LON peptidase substrate-binding domain-containing protein [Calditrichaeota bacterium]|nr:LON peptidase substrate-binding domain-containing protein [Calditrichota bacterium]